MNDLYSPGTLEHIATENPQSWMSRAGINAPNYDRATSSCFFRNGAWVIETNVLDLDRLRLEAGSIIDAAAGDARARYITIAPGQEITYLLKAQQAESFKAAGYASAVPEFIQAEADATGMTPAEAADYILATRDALIPKAAQIESARRRGKVAVAAATTELNLDIAVNTAVDELRLI